MGGWNFREDGPTMRRLGTGVVREIVLAFFRDGESHQDIAARLHMRARMVAKIIECVTGFQHTHGGGRHSVKGRFTDEFAERVIRGLDERLASIEASRVAWESARKGGSSASGKAGRQHHRASVSSGA